MTNRDETVTDNSLGGMVDPSVTNLGRPMTNRDETVTHKPTSADGAEWVMAPKVPTDAMHLAGVDAMTEDLRDGEIPVVPRIYAAMLAAAPASPSQGVGTGVVERLHHAITTAANDDRSEPMSEKRARHVARMTAMVEAADALQSSEAERGKFIREAGDYFAKWCLETEARVTAEANVAVLREALEPLSGIRVGVSMNDSAPVAFPVIGDCIPITARQVRAARRAQEGKPGANAAAEVAEAMAGNEAIEAVFGTDTPEAAEFLRHVEIEARRVLKRLEQTDDVVINAAMDRAQRASDPDEAVAIRSRALVDLVALRAARRAQEGKSNG